MESAYLRTFVEVVHCGSFSRAAELLFITQSAVSRRVKFMEEQYGTTLFDRSGPGLSPTKADLMVYEKALRLLALENELAQELQKIHGLIPLSFACSRPFGITHLPGITKMFLSRYDGKVELRLNFETPAVAFHGLREGRHDIVVIEHWEKPDFDPYYAVRLGRDDIVLVSSPQLGLPVSITVDELLIHRLYRRSDECCSSRLLAQNMISIGRKAEEFKNVLIYDDLHVIIASVCAGEGIAFLSRSIVQGLIQAKTLREHRVENFCLSRKRTLVCRHEVSANHAFHFFVTCIIKSLGIGGDIMEGA